MSDLQDADLSFLSGFKPKEVQLTNEDVNHPNVQAYLSYLNTYEGKPAENQTVGYKSFKDLSDHPKIQVAFNDKGDTSDAAGAYQILGKTWDAQKKKLGLKDFTLTNQQKAAVGILKDIGALDHIKNGDFDKANELAKDQWASLPGSKIGAATGQIPKVNPEAEAILQKAKQDYDPDVSFVSGFTPKQNVENLPPKKISDISAFSNNQPNQQNESITPTSTDVLKRFGKDFEKSVSGMSWEDFKKKSLIAPAATYTAASLGIPGFTEQEKKEAQQNLQQKLGAAFQGVKNVANMPVQDFSQTIVKAAKEIKEHPGTFAGSNLQSMAYDPEQVFLPQAISALGKPIVSTGGKVANAVREAAMAEPEIASKVNAIKASTSQAKEQLNQGFENLKNKFNEPEANVTGAPNVGAALTTKQSAVNALLPNLSPETQSVIKSAPIEKVNLPALETKGLEEDLGIKLSKSQRIGDKQGYASEWNARDTDKKIQRLFSEQPQQFVDAFEKIKDRYAGDIGELTKENIGQLEINALAAKDKVRTDAINQAKQKLIDENGGKFPIDVGALKNNIDNELTKQYKSRHLSNAIKGDLEDFYKNPNFEGYEHLRSNLADEMRSAKNGISRQAAWIARNELEKLPIFNEEIGSPQAIKLKALADNYRALNVERYNVIKTNPAYKAAIKEATDAEDAGAMESINAANFHDKFVTGKTATPESVRRMMEELKDDSNAVKAIRAGDILNAENALVPNKATPQLKPDSYNSYLRNQADKTKYIHSTESAQDLLNIGILSSKVAKPAENVFNFSNSYSAYLGDLMKQGIQLKGEGALAAATKGASILPVQALKSASEFINKNKFAAETVHPHSGLVNKE